MVKKDNLMEKNDNIEKTEIWAEIWIQKNKKWIISGLNDNISDLEDEHYSTPKFFKNIRQKIDKWENTWKLETKPIIERTEETNSNIFRCCFTIIFTISFITLFRIILGSNIW